MLRLKILSLNVRGLGSPTKSRQIVHELSFSKCDIALLHETHVSSKKQADKFEKLWNGNCFWSFGTGKSAGVAVLFSPNFCGKVISFLYDSDSRILSLLIACDHFKLNVVNINLLCSGSDRKSFFSGLHKYFILQGDLIISGDFSCIDNVLDKLNYSIVPSSDRNSLCSLD